MNIKIIDFGLSNTFLEGELLKTACGSPCYAAPEMIAGKKYKPVHVDVWSCGVILYAMICGYLPFEDNDTAKLYKKIMDGDFEQPDFLSKNAIDLLKCMLTTDPETRYSFDQVKQHVWYLQDQPFEPLHDPNEPRSGATTDNLSKPTTVEHTPSPITQKRVARGSAHKPVGARTNNSQQVYALQVNQIFEELNNT